MKEELRLLIRSFHKREFNFKLRLRSVPLDTKKIVSIIGSRRVGKTYFFYQLINKLMIEHEVPKENILYINFEDERIDFKQDNLKNIIEVYGELYPQLDMSKCYFFFDEIQNIDGWEKFVRRVYDNYTKHIYITGSSAKLLSKEIATSLRGRSISYDIYPLSFKEYLNFKNVEIDINYEKSLFKIKHEFANYLKFGAYPEIVDENEEVCQKSYQEYLNVMTFKDIIERYNLKNKELLSIFIKKVLSNISSEFSIHKFYNELKSQGIKVSKDLVYEYPNYLQDIYLVYFLECYEKNIMKKSFASKKVYANDIGFVNLFKFSEDYGRILENIVFIELKRREKEIYYHKENQECDFVVKQGLKIIQAIQVTKSIKDIDTRKREIKGLLDAMKCYSLDEGLILTNDEEEVIYEKIEEKEVKIQVKPVYRWLLENINESLGNKD